MWQSWVQWRVGRVVATLVYFWEERKHLQLRATYFSATGRGCWWSFFHFPLQEVIVCNRSFNHFLSVLTLYLNAFSRLFIYTPLQSQAPAGCCRSLCPGREDPRSKDSWKSKWQDSNSAAASRLSAQIIGSPWPNIDPSHHQTVPLHMYSCTVFS